jgi:serine/threonine protein kinase
MSVKGGFSIVRKTATKFPLESKNNEILAHGVRKSFENEVKIINAIKKQTHRNIVEYYSVSISCITMEWGDNLWSVVFYGSYIDWSFELLNGLNFLHNLGIYHGDVCTSNIIVVDGVIPKWCDFGSSGFIGDRKYFCRLEYSNPQLTNDREKDLYGLMLVLWCIKNKAELIPNYIVDLTKIDCYPLKHKLRECSSKMGRLIVLACNHTYIDNDQDPGSPLYSLEICSECACYSCSRERKMTGSQYCEGCRPTRLSKENCDEEHYYNNQVYCKTHRVYSCPGELVWAD